MRKAKSKMSYPKQLSLITTEEITVHCFFRCPYITRSVDPQEAHDLMERHYAEKHARRLEQIVMRLK